MKDVSVLLLHLPRFDSPALSRTLACGRGSELCITFTGKTSPGPGFHLQGICQWHGPSATVRRKAAPPACGWSGEHEASWGASQAVSHLLGWHPEAFWFPSNLLGAFPSAHRALPAQSPPGLWKTRQEKEEQLQPTVEILPTSQSGSQRQERNT